jgi:endonuclease/exonuclease/phosphatase family metal-dependent hydrolase
VTRPFRLLTYNIRRGGEGREAPLSAVVSACEPDLVILQEATRPDVIERLARECGLPFCGARPRTSLGFLARHRPSLHEWHRPRLSRHAFLEVMPADSDLRVFGVHLSAVHAAWTERRRALELHNLMRAIRAHQHGPHALVGDFNTLAPGELLDIRQLPYRLRAMVWLSGGRVRWRTIQIVLDAGYVDGYRAAHPGDAGLTFPVWNPHVRLDYIFMPPAHAARLQSIEIVRHPATADASDHFPVLAEISPRP